MAYFVHLQKDNNPAVRISMKGFSGTWGWPQLGGICVWEDVNKGMVPEAPQSTTHKQSLI